MGGRSKDLPSKHHQSLFIGKPVVYRRPNPMARIGVLKGSDVRCLSSTFMVVVFFACVFLLTLQPSQYPTKISMVDLPKDEVVRAQSIAELGPLTAGGKTGGKGSGKDNKKNAKNDQKNSKKANKAKWFKDELPKKVHNLSIPTPPTLNSGGGVVDKQVDVNKQEEVAAKQVQQAEVDGNQQQVQNEAAEKASNDTKPPPPAMPKSEEKLKAKSGPRSLTPFSNLSNLPIKSFVSPFIDPDAVMQKPEKKIVTWHKPENPHAVMKKKGVFDDCPISACKIVFPLPPTLAADAIIFEKIDKKHPPPPRVHNDQAYVFHMMTPLPYPQQPIWPPAWNSAFNWTWTYRRDSDIWQPFGLLKKSNKVRSADFLLELTKGKTKAAAWMPRTCGKETSSRRDEFVEELKKHIRVAEFGPCFNKTCAKEGMSCTEVLSKKFFFLLALEDNLCRDHVTEVFYRAWQEDTYIVPVVRGGTDYSAYFPEGTFVDADWFDSPKQLAEFLTELMTSRRLYSQLLWRKSHWVRANKATEDLSLCHLCYKLHHLDSTRKRYRDIRRWFEKSACNNPRPFS